MAQELQTSNSPKYLRRSGQSEVSVYDDGQLTAKVLVEQNKRLRTAFPDITEDYIKLLNQILKERNFSDEHFTDAVTNLIMTYKWPSTPRLADILGYDVRVKTFTYNQVCDLVAGGEKMADFTKKGDAWIFAKDDNLF